MISMYFLNVLASPCESLRVLAVSGPVRRVRPDFLEDSLWRSCTDQAQVPQVMVVICGHHGVKHLLSATLEELSHWELGQVALFQLVQPSRQLSCPLLSMLAVWRGGKIRFGYAILCTVPFQAQNKMMLSCVTNSDWKSWDRKIHVNPYIHADSYVCM